MATLNGENAALINADASSKAAVGDQGGRVRMLKDKFSLTGDLSLNDIIQMGGKLPQGASVVDVILSWDALGAGALDVGWADGAGGLESADADGFLAAVAVTSAGLAKMSDTDEAVPGYLKDFDEEVQVQIQVQTDTSATSGDIELVVLYVVE